MKYIKEESPFPEFIMVNKYNDFIVQDMKRDLKIHVNECEYCLSHIPCEWVKNFLDLFVYIEAHRKESK